MKSLIILASLLLLFVPLFRVQKTDLLSFEEIGEVFFVENGKVEKQTKKNFSQAELLKVDGIVLSFEDKTMKEIQNLLKVKVVKVERVEGIDIVYGYTDLYSGHIFLDKKMVNVQLASSNQRIIAGFPIILSGY